MSEGVGKYYAEGDKLKELLPHSLEDIYDGLSYYEVIRVMEGVCLFLEDHIDRLRESVRLAGLTYPIRREEIAHILQGLISAGRVTEGNIRIVFKPYENKQPSLFSYFIPHAYPGPAQYSQGVPVALYRIVRMNPNIKQYHPDYHRQVKKFISDKQIYEALLVDETNAITEGSKSNVFFIHEDTVLTAPGEQVLKGITRQKVLKLCETLNIKIIETTTSTESLREIQAAFITGTSPKILPVRNIDALQLKTDHPVMRSLMKAYDGMISDYIRKEKGYLE